MGQRESVSGVGRTLDSTRVGANTEASPGGTHPRERGRIKPWGEDRKEVLCEFLGRTVAHQASMTGFALDALKVILGTKIGSLRKHSMALSLLIKLIEKQHRGYFLL